METVKAVVLMTCIIGVISAIADISLPEGGLKKQVAAVVGMVLILTVATPFLGSGFTVSLKDYTELAELPEYGEIEDKAQELYIDEAEKRLEEYFEDKLNSNGIADPQITVVADIGDGNEIEVSEVRIKIDDRFDKELVKSLISDDLPYAEVTFLQEDIN